MQIFSIRELVREDNILNEKTNLHYLLELHIYFMNSNMDTPNPKWFIIFIFSRKKKTLFPLM